MKMTAEQARALGIEVGPNGRGRINPKKRVSTGQVSTVDAATVREAVNQGKRASRPKTDPQEIIYQGLCDRLGDDCVEWERKGLVPGRKFRADVYLPESRLVVEMDGFQYHRSKDAFQTDRKRQNLMVRHGLAVLRYFTNQVLNELESVLDEIEAVHHSRRELLSNWNTNPGREAS